MSAGVVQDMIPDQEQKWIHVKALRTTIVPHKTLRGVVADVAGDAYRAERALKLDSKGVESKLRMSREFPSKINEKLNETLDSIMQLVSASTEGTITEVEMQKAIEAYRAQQFAAAQ